MSLKLNYDSADTQTIIVTLSESMESSLKSITGLTYGFTFTHEQTDNTYKMDLTDKSVVPFRYNEFELTTSLTTRPPNNIELNEVGWYKYEVYFNDGKNEILLEIGKMYLDDGKEATNTYDQTKIKYVYKK